MAVEGIKNICAVGAGAMGSGTALCFAMAGLNVRLYDLTEASVESGKRNIQSVLETYLGHNFIQKSDIPVIMGRIKTTTTLEEAAAGADLVIESIVENLETKRKVFAALDKICPPHAIFATNTSGLSPTKIAEAVERKDKFVVTHFWNPPYLIPLVEVVPGQHTSQETMDIACRLMKKIGKKPVPLKREALGFVGNRLQLALLREALHIVASGIASAEDVDTVIEYSLGRRLSETGPLKSADLGGLDVFRNIFGYLGTDLCNDAGIPPILEKAVAEGKLGAKTGAGLYPWPAEKLAAIRERRERELIRHLEKDLSPNEVDRAKRRVSGAT
jgi:3-hydroxybutyryl-CoA dehydrogenase